MDRFQSTYEQRENWSIIYDVKVIENEGHSHPKEYQLNQRNNR